MRRPLSLAVVAAALAMGGPASAAYCRSVACTDGNQGSRCTDGIGPGDSTELCDGPELYWTPRCIGFTVQKDGSTPRNGSADLSPAQAASLVNAAFDAWMNAPCPGGAPSITIFDLGVVSCDRVEYNEHAGNANIIMFRDDTWPYDDMGGGATDTIALTTVTFDTGTGEIYDADMELNSADNTFSTSPIVPDGYVDLLSVLTHETGHFIGLAHSEIATATMNPYYPPHSTTLRDLDTGDVEAVCAVYPPGRGGVCTGLPRHGFSPACANDQTEGNCAYHAPSRGDRGVALSLVALAMAALKARTSRRRSRGTRSA